MLVVFFLGFVNYDYFILVCTILSLQLFISSVFSIFLFLVPSQIILLVSMCM